MEAATIQPPIDLHDMRARYGRIVRARAEARADYVKYGEEEADAEREYRKRKAVSLAQYRSEGKAQDESMTLAEGDVADHRHQRDMAHVLRRAAELRIAELEANRAMLRVEFEAGERL